MAEYFNHEKYPDPTAYEVIRNMELEEKKQEKIRNGEWFMRWIYVASPYKGDVETNVNNAKKSAQFVAKQDLLPVAPHLYLTQVFNDDIEEERNAGLAFGLQMLKRCHEMWVFGDHVSDGMAIEIEFATKRNIPIRYFSSECKEVKKYGY